MTTVRELTGNEGKPTGIVTIGPDDTITTAAARMRDHRIGSLVVTGPDRKAIGIITERDIVSRVLTTGIDPGRARVRDSMSFPIVSCATDAPIEEAQDLMNRFSTRHVVIVDEGLPVGMVSSREVMRHLFAEDGRMRNLAIFALAKLAESRDPETGGHLERVCEYARLLALHLARTPKFCTRIDDDFVELIHVTSPLHDIGKVCVPDEVLRKPSRLDPDEFEVMKTHTERGAETLDLALKAYPNAEFLRMARDIAVAHHERIDGRGYPRGLAGEEIPLSARIFALADVYDALISKRVYKEAIDHITARSIIIKGAGVQFDIDVVQAFMECENLFFDLRQRYAGANAIACA